MKLTLPWTRLLTGCLGVGLALTLTAASSPAQESRATPVTTPITTTREVKLPPANVTDIHFPATITKVSGEWVTVNADGTLLELSHHFAAFTMNGQRLEGSKMRVGQNVDITYPTFTGRIDALNGPIIMFRTVTDRVVTIPVRALTPALLAEPTLVKLSDGTYAQVPLRTALTLQEDRGATVVSSLPAGATLTPYAAVEEKAAEPPDRHVDQSESEWYEKDLNKRMQDETLDGDSNF